VDSHAFLCDECEAFWLEEARLGTGDWVDYGTFMRQKGMRGLWGELQEKEEIWYDGRSDALPVTSFVVSTAQAFSAMLHYLDIWRSMGEEGDISALLRQLGEVSEGKPASDAVWTQWLESVRTVTAMEGSAEALLTPRQALDAAVDFLGKRYAASPSDDLGVLLGGLRPIWGPGTTGDPAAWYDWLEAVRRALVQR